MIRSMTGFGRASFRVGGVAFEVEVRSVNHRHLDLRVRLPAAAFGLRAGRTRARPGPAQPRQGRARRVDARGGRSAPADRDRPRRRPRVRADRGGAPGVGGAGGPARPSTRCWGCPAWRASPNASFRWRSSRRAFSTPSAAAAEALDEMRVSEGAALERDLLARLETVTDLSDSLEARSGAVRDAARERLRKRAEQLEQETGILDEARLHQEIVIAADRLDITEEIVRLRSHVDQFREIVAAGRPRPTRRAPPRLSAAGVRPRGQHHRLQGQRRARRPPGRRAQDRDRTHARAGPER